MRVQHDEELLNLINEVISEKKKEKAAKVATARTLWVPALKTYGSIKIVTPTEFLAIIE